jgi:hypothetical protein
MVFGAWYLDVQDGFDALDLRALHHRELVAHATGGGDLELDVDGEEQLVLVWEEGKVFETPCNAWPQLQLEEGASSSRAEERFHHVNGRGSGGEPGPHKRFARLTLGAHL